MVITGRTEEMLQEATTNSDRLPGDKRTTA